MCPRAVITAMFEADYLFIFDIRRSHVAVALPNSSGPMAYTGVLFPIRLGFQFTGHKHIGLSGLYLCAYLLIYILR